VAETPAATPRFALAGVAASEPAIVATAMKAANVFFIVGPPADDAVGQRRVDVFPFKIRLRADWIAVILALSARLPAMDDRRNRNSPETGR
jgi:hypothetical protein